MPECRIVHTGLRVPQSGTGMLRYCIEMLDARIPMPAASASMPMPSYGKKTEKFTKKVYSKHNVEPTPNFHNQIVFEL
jgi:hypothetical protein